MTNLEKIRRMSAAELADIFEELACCRDRYSCKYCILKDVECSITDNIRKWLESEVKE